MALFLQYLLWAWFSTGLTWSKYDMKRESYWISEYVKLTSQLKGVKAFCSGGRLVAARIEFENDHYLLVKSAEDSSGMTLVLRYNEKQRTSGINGIFSRSPEAYDIRGNVLIFSWKHQRQSEKYTYFARCEYWQCLYRPSLTSVEMLIDSVSVSNWLKNDSERTNVRNIAVEDSIWQMKIKQELRDLKKSQSSEPTSYILKPMIYLYPDSAMPVDVRIGPVSSLAMAYPKDDSGMWQVQAYPDGRLVERKTGKEFYGLYWEGKNWTPPSSDTGVVVRGSEFPRALDSLLELKGLNYRERQECVTFWMHSLVNSPWVMIQFFDQEFAKAHPLDISPAPTTLLRVALSFRTLTEPVSLHPPVLVKPLRRGFTVVEWGGQIKGEE